MNFYCFSGLGADKSVFQFLEIEGVKFHYVDWIEPLNNESLEDYSRRLIGNLKLRTPYSFIGVSFGGMIALEASKITNPINVFLVSSAQSSLEIPIIFRLLERTKLYKIIPDRLFRTPNRFTNYLFGASRLEEKKILDNIIRNIDVKFLKWAFGAIVNWVPKENKKAIRIHGTKDRIIPLRVQNISLRISGGSHLLIVRNANEVSGFISALL
ncbi:hypothetical protein AWW67_05425 [Roseivirga seohaensis]|uniref:AB hydrolase-1 domain-containing protein n=1 Tax=Roseivirga seohaensis TaxID=1914963 RepID=A0A150Y0Q6_9BACT|nr:alpha/beta hydrolase [Roseivirga seohaensis]KYG84551.1 hypothetical protein AWW67_05425 [Roseivirga seohaensis]